MLAHLSLLLERFDSEAVSSDVHYGSQLEPVRWVGRPHRLPILHRTALKALENMTQGTVRGVFSLLCVYAIQTLKSPKNYNFGGVFFYETEVGYMVEILCTLEI